MKPMQALEEKNDLATLVIRHHVKARSRNHYESWLKEIARERQRFKGHLGANVIRPPDGSGDYTVVVRFASETTLLDWMESDTRRRLLEHAQPHLETPEVLEIETGMEYWFTPQSPKPARAKPFKQFLISLSAIYPLIVAVPWALQPLFNAVPQLAHPLAAKLLIAIIVVLLMVNVVMPRYTRLVASWLYK
jgi:antibiotic biosynthesis monooxygenase (ABM) superfamily enzyme